MMTLFLGLREHAPTTTWAHSHTRSAATAGTSRSLGPPSTLGFVTYCSKASSSKSEPQTLSETILSSHHPLPLQPPSVQHFSLSHPTKAPAALLPAPVTYPLRSPHPSRPPDLACPSILSPSTVCPPSYPDLSIFSPSICHNASPTQFCLAVCAPALSSGSILLTLLAHI